jgi:hypothetical protein
VLLVWVCHNFYREQLVLRSTGNLGFQQSRIFFKNPYGYGDPDEMKPIIEELHHFSSQPISLKKKKISEKLLKEYYLQKD